MNRILSLQFYLVSSSSAAPWPGALPLQLRDFNYGNGDTNTFSKRMFEQFTQYLTGWQICQLPLSSEGSKLFSFRGASPPDPLTPGSAPGPRWGLRPRPPLQPPPHCKPPGLATECLCIDLFILDIVVLFSCSCAIEVNSRLKQTVKAITTLKQSHHLTV